MLNMLQSAKYSFTLVDFQKVYEDYCKIRHSSYIAWDRVHPNQVGATLMARTFLKACNFDYSFCPHCHSVPLPRAARFPYPSQNPLLTILS